METKHAKGGSQSCNQFQMFCHCKLTTNYTMVAKCLIISPEFGEKMNEIFTRSNSFTLTQKKFVFFFNRKRCKNYFLRRMDTLLVWIICDVSVCSLLFIMSWHRAACRQ